jgi:hypothetical protein
VWTVPLPYRKGWTELYLRATNRQTAPVEGAQKKGFVEKGFRKKGFKTFIFVGRSPIS